MNQAPVIAVFSGGVSGEKSVSERSAEAVVTALRQTGSFPVEVFSISAERLPPEIDPGRHVVFSTLHGVFGEDGGMQDLLDKKGVHYAGSNALSSRLCMDKSAAKARVHEAGLRVPPGIHFQPGDLPSVSRAAKELGYNLVLKPNAEGSSLGLRFVDNAGALEATLAGLGEGDWLLEKRVSGRELTVGVLDGKSLGVVEIVPTSGVYDYSSKYTAGSSRYHAPAALSEEATGALRRCAEAAFAACGCRDFARVDFILEEGASAPCFLEINTLPGLTETSLLPMSAACEGIHFNHLIRALIMPAVHRFLQSKDIFNPLPTKWSEKNK